MSTSTTETTTVPRLIESTLEVFDTMVFTALEPGTPDHDAKQPAGTVMGAVGFLGSMSGRVSVYASDAAACQIAGNLLGIEPGEAVDQMADAIGEITNMVAGTFRGRMAQAGETLMITTPTVTIGTDFHAQHFNVISHVVCPFMMGPYTLYVELILQAA